jgi:hypothetical protein
MLWVTDHVQERDLGRLELSYRCGMCSSKAFEKTLADRLALKISLELSG